MHPYAGLQTDVRMTAFSLKKPPDGAGCTEETGPPAGNRTFALCRMHKKQPEKL